MEAIERDIGPTSSRFSLSASLSYYESLMQFSALFSQVCETAPLDLTAIASAVLRSPTTEAINESLSARSVYSPALQAYPFGFVALLDCTAERLEIRSRGVVSAILNNSLNLAKV